VFPVKKRDSPVYSTYAGDNGEPINWNTRQHQKERVISHFYSFSTFRTTNSSASRRQYAKWSTLATRKSCIVSCVTPRLAPQRKSAATRGTSTFSFKTSSPTRIHSDCASVLHRRLTRKKMSRGVTPRFNAFNRGMWNGRRPATLVAWYDGVS
jgi:hypothetical protein